MPAYKALVRPLLEYCQEIWSPHLVCDISLIENVQRRATKLIPEVAHLSYDERIKALDLFRLADRRRRGDMITVFKLMNNLMHVDTKLFTLMSEIKGTHNMSTRRTNQKIKLKYCNNTIRDNWFSYRTIVPWNTLPQKITESKNVDEFKWNYDSYIKHQNLKLLPIHQK